MYKKLFCQAHRGTTCGKHLQGIQRFRWTWCGRRKDTQEVEEKLFDEVYCDGEDQKATSGMQGAEQKLQCLTLERSFDGDDNDNDDGSTGEDDLRWWSRHQFVYPTLEKLGEHGTDWVRTLSMPSIFCMILTGWHGLAESRRSRSAGRTSDFLGYMDTECIVSCSYTGIYQVMCTWIARSLSRIPVYAAARLYPVQVFSESWCFPWE